MKRITVTPQDNDRLPFIEEAVYVLHGFTKKTQQTSKRDLDLAAKRYKKLQNDKGEK